MDNPLEWIWGAFLFLFLLAFFAPFIAIPFLIIYWIKNPPSKASINRGWKERARIRGRERYRKIRFAHTGKKVGGIYSESDGLFRDGPNPWDADEYDG